MKFLLITLLSTLATVTGQLMDAPLDETLVTPLEAAPEMVVIYVSEQATDTACTEHELMYIDSKMIPDIDMTLLANNFETPEWEFGIDPSVRKLNGGATCDWCRTVYPRNLCNSIYNCGFRRNLRKSQDASRQLNNVELSMDILQGCRDNLKALSKSRYLSPSCKVALSTALCQVQFV